MGAKISIRIKHKQTTYQKHETDFNYSGKMAVNKHVYSNKHENLLAD